MIEILRRDERAVLSLRGLYESYGYKKYKMSKFENYDLYLENKTFLASEKIVTFSGKGGKLLALKPDITLSIIKNSPAKIEGTYKTYYSENVYRASDSSGDIKEIMQAGIELIGKVDLYSEGEVLALAARSIKVINENSIIGISHMGLIAAILADAGIDGAMCERVRKCIADKNIHTLKELLSDNPDAGEKLAKLAMIYGPIDTALESVREICASGACADAIAELEGLAAVLEAMGEKSSFVLDFSISNDMDYYNGITFQGFVDGIPRHVLSGGRYDNLVRKMGRDADAIGFAVYLDLLERFGDDEKTPDVDVLLVYGNADAATVALRVEQLEAEGKKVCAVSCESETAPTYREREEI